MPWLEAFYSNTFDSVCRMISLTDLAVDKPTEGPGILGPITSSHPLLRYIFDLHLDTQNTFAVLWSIQ